MQLFSKKPKPTGPDAPSTSTSVKDVESDHEKQEPNETVVPTADSTRRLSSHDENTLERKIEGMEAEADAQAQQEDRTDYPHGIKLLAITLALCLSVFCMALDNTIIAT